jgi:hypothetical protein
MYEAFVMYFSSVSCYSPVLRPSTYYCPLRPVLINSYTRVRDVFKIPDFTFV